MNPHIAHIVTGLAVVAIAGCTSTAGTPAPASPPAVPSVTEAALSPSATPELTPTPTSAHTPAPTPALTPAPVPGKCLVLEQVYCSAAKIIQVEFGNGMVATEAAVNVPAGAAIFAPAAGFVSEAGTSLTDPRTGKRTTLPSLMMGVSAKDGSSFAGATAMWIITVDHQPANPPAWPVTPGTRIATVTGTPIPGLPGYTLLVDINKLGAGGMETPELTTLRAIFGH